MSREYAVPRFKIYNEARVRSIADLEWLSRNLPGWVFRGQADSRWRLQPALERLSSTAPFEELERRGVRDFKAQWLSMDRPAPPEDDYLNWLGLARHHGVPTRLLDFTTSLAVAVYFAHREGGERSPAVWAVNGLILAKLLSSQVVEAQRGQLAFDDPVQGWSVFNRLYPHRVHGFGAAVFAPRGNNMRMTAQNGVFLAALNMNHSLEQNLYGMFDRDPVELFETGPQGHYTDVRKDSTLRGLQKAPVLKLELTMESPNEVEEFLTNEGITESELFPDE